MDEYEVIIKANQPWYKIDIKDLIRYKDLILLFVKRNFALVYKQTILGPLWLVLSPLLTSIVFAFVFGQFAGLSTDGVPHLLFYLTGTTIWGLFSNSVQNISKTFLDNAHVFGKVYFPRLAVPISKSITNIINFGIQMALILIFYVYYTFIGEVSFISSAILLFPILVIQAAALAMAVGIIIASVTVKYRDLAIAATLCLQLWMYLTPVVYPLSSTEGMMYTLLLLNPMTPIVNNFRYAVLGAGELLLLPWIGSMVVTLFLLMAGALLFSNAQKTFVDKI